LAIQLVLPWVEQVLPLEQQEPKLVSLERQLGLLEQSVEPQPGEMSGPRVSVSVGLVVVWVPPVWQLVEEEV
jgi:hypothetical protein